MSTIPPTGHTGLPNGPPWRVLVLDRDREDPKFLLCVIASPDDVRPASGEAELDEVTRRSISGRQGTATELAELRHAKVWRVDRVGR